MRGWGVSLVVIGLSVGLGGPTAANPALGDSAADLVYTPVPPCRIIDTRLAGGPIVPGTPRTFHVTGTTGFDTQGGHAGGCGIPAGATGAMLNFVAVSPAGPGDLRAWPFGEAVPLASIINYAAVSGLNLANGAVVRLCDPAATTCTFDLSVQADVSAADLVVDVMGFLQSTAPRGATTPFNTFLGADAGNVTMTGSGNTATGAFALQSNTTGFNETATGAGALQSNTTGTTNTATGVSALLINTTGSNNTATGAGALFNNTTGSHNTATGFNALQSNTTGTNNTAVGSGANVLRGDLTNATAIGSGVLVDASHKIRLGNSAVTVIEGPVGFTSTSDATQKEHFQPVEGEAVLRKLRGLTATSWNFIGHDPTRFRHYGPSAQEFFAAFGHDGIGTIGTPTTITSTDLAGILLIAVQALERRTAEAAALRARLDSVERLVRSHPALRASAERPGE